MADSNVNDMIRKILLKNSEMTDEQIEAQHEKAIESTKKIDQTKGTIEDAMIEAEKKEKKEKKPKEEQQEEQPEESADLMDDDMRGGSLNVIKMKPVESYPIDLLEAINTLINKKEDSEVFGSYVYRSQSYPGDVDVHEMINLCCSPEQATAKMAEILQKIVKRVKQKKDYYFSEVKSGNDTRFMLDIDAPDYMQRLKKLRSNGLLDRAEYRGLSRSDLMSNTENKEIAKELIRNLYVLRWTEKEVLQGYKIMRGNKKITLADSMNMKGHIKIDIHAPINGRYIEITNFFILSWYDKESKELHLINTDEFHYIESMLDQIYKLSSKLFFNPYKLSKRLWGLSRHTKNERYLKILTPFMQSGTARMNQIKGEIDVIKTLLKRPDVSKLWNSGTKSSQIKIMRKQIDEFKSRLSYVYDVEFDEMQIYNLIDEIIMGKLNAKDTIKNLDEIEDMLKKVISDTSLKFLEDNRLYPFNRRLFGLGTPEGATKNKWIEYIRNYVPITGTIEEFEAYKSKYKQKKKKNKKNKDDKFIKSMIEYQERKNKEREDFKKVIKFMNELPELGAVQRGKKTIEPELKRAYVEYEPETGIVRDVTVEPEVRRAYVEPEPETGIVRDVTVEPEVKRAQLEYEPETGVVRNVTFEPDVKMAKIEEAEAMHLFTTISEVYKSEVEDMTGKSAVGQDVDVDVLKNIVNEIPIEDVELLNRMMDLVPTAPPMAPPMPPTAPPMAPPMPPIIAEEIKQATKQMEPLLEEYIKDLGKKEVHEMNRMMSLPQNIYIYCGSQSDEPRRRSEPVYRDEPVRSDEPVRRSYEQPKRSEDQPKRSDDQPVKKFADVKPAEQKRPKKPTDIIAAKAGEDKYEGKPRKKLNLDPAFIKELEEKINPSK